VPRARLLHSAIAKQHDVTGGVCCIGRCIGRPALLYVRYKCAGRQAVMCVLLNWLQAVKITPQTDFSRLKVGQLKELLRDRGISCRDCFEKADFISKLRELAAAQT
jgi:ARMET, C-terminal